MKKNKSKGFMLAETLIAATFILGTLVFLFIQFRNVNQGYQTTFKYNTVNALYAAENTKKFYMQDNFISMAETFRNDKMKYIDLSDCPTSYVNETDYCRRLKEVLEIKTILFIDENTTYVQSVFDSIDDISESMKRFIEYIKYDDELLKYRLVVEMEDGTFATIKIY